MLLKQVKVKKKHYQLPTSLGGCDEAYDMVRLICPYHLLAHTALCAIFKDNQLGLVLTFMYSICNKVVHNL